MIHLAHDFTDATVLVFGGGTVGARRARSFDEARVIVVSPAFVDEEFGGASLVRAEPDAADARSLIDRADPALVVAATDDGEFNASVATAARDADALVNRVDRAAARTGHVDVPATTSAGAVVASVSTGGHSPVLSAVLRDWIADDLEGCGELVGELAERRDELREHGLPLARRRELVRTVVESERVWEAARDPGGDQLATVIDEVLADEERGRND